MLIVTAPGIDGGRRRSLRLVPFALSIATLLWWLWTPVVAPAQERDCLDGERLLELPYDNPEVELTPDGLYFPIEGTTAKLPVIADVVDLVVLSGTGEPVEITLEHGGEITFDEAVAAPELTRVSGGPADAFRVAGAGNEGFLVQVCYEVLPPPATTPFPPIETEPPTIATVPALTEPSPIPAPDGTDSNGGFPFWPAAIGVAAASLGGWGWKVYRDRVKFHREWELRSEETERTGPCTPGAMYCHKVTGDVDVRMRQFTEVAISGITGEGDAVEDKASRGVLSDLKSARRFALLGEDATRLAERLTAPAQDLARDVARFMADRQIDGSVTAIARFEGSSVTVTFVLKRCIAGEWRTVDRWKPKVELKDDGDLRRPVEPTRDSCLDALTALLDHLLNRPDGESR